MKILDFGLAKAVEESVVPGEPTVTVQTTRDGAIVGTVTLLASDGYGRIAKREYVRIF